MKSIVLVVCSALLLCACVPRTTAYRRQAPAPPAPCSPTVAPILGHSALVVSVTTNFNYNPKDRSGAQSSLPVFVVGELNDRGSTNGNSFQLQNGQQINFSYVFNISNNNEQFTGTLEFGGWGQGHIKTFSTQYPYNDPSRMFLDLVDQSYGFVSGGWHDNRSQCMGK